MEPSPLQVDIAKEALEIAQHLVDGSGTDIRLADEKLQEWLTEMLRTAIAEADDDALSSDLLETASERAHEELTFALEELGYSDSHDTVFNKAFEVVDKAMVKSDEIVDNAHSRRADDEDYEGSPYRYHGHREDDF